MVSGYLVKVRRGRGPAGLLEPGLVDFIGDCEVQVRLRLLWTTRRPRTGSTRTSSADAGLWRGGRAVRELDTGTGWSRLSRDGQADVVDLRAPGDSTSLVLRSTTSMQTSRGWSAIVAVPSTSRLGGRVAYVAIRAATDRALQTIRSANEAAAVGPDADVVGQARRSFAPT